MKGVLVDRDLHNLLKKGAIAAAAPLVEGQVQPASFDLRLGARAWRVQAGFLPGKGRKVEDCVKHLAMNEIDLTQPQLFEKGAVYIVPLQEALRLPDDILGGASPKSSTGRLDIFVRVVIDGASTYDTVPAGYTGPLYLEISPLTFPIVARQGDRLVQLRLRRGDARIQDAELRKLNEEVALLRDLREPLLDGFKAQMDDGLWISIDLHGVREGHEGPVGFRARHHTQPVDLARVGGYDWRQFWEPIHRHDCKPLILYPEEFYIFASREGICVPPSHAAELVAYDTRIGEIRVHYAGFFDPGFGFDGDHGVHGTTAVLEVRAHDVPCVLEDGQPIGRFLYERLLQPPQNVYGAGIGSNYAGQGLKLAKQFVMK
jgi:dCTP deaminase